MTNKIAVVVEIDNPTPIAYLNLYEQGDLWLKIKGCEDCPIESRRRCCNQCPMLVKDNGLCMLHMGVGSLNKPFECVVRPNPKNCLSWCQLEYKCISGKNEGKIRKVNTPAFGFSVS